MDNDLICRGELLRRLEAWRDEIARSNECGGCAGETAQQAIDMVDAMAPVIGEGEAVADARRKLSLRERRMLNEMQWRIHYNAAQHGFYDKYSETRKFLKKSGREDLAQENEMNFVLAQLVKISSEIGEAVGAIQKVKSGEEYAEELADVFIRLMDLAEFQGIRMADAIDKKMQKNAGRPYLHGKRC